MMHRTAQVRVLHAVTLAAMAGFAPVQTQAAPTNSGEVGIIGEAAAAWKARQDVFETVRMRWTAREWFAKGGISQSLPKMTAEASKLKVQPPEDASFHVPYRLTIDGVKVRAEYTGWQWDTSDGRFNATKWASVFDGVLSKECYLEREGTDTWPRGSVLQKDAYDGARYGFLRAPFVFFRPLEKKHFGIDLTSFTCSGTKVKIRGFDCFDLQQRSAGNIAAHLWVDKGRGFVVVRQLVLVGNTPSLQIDYDYRKDQKHGWLLAGWQLSSMSNSGRVTETSTVVVDDLNVNERIDKNVCGLIFPSGGKIADGVDRTEYLIRDDGTKRILGRHEMKIPYETLVELVRSERRRVNFQSAGLVVAAIVCLSLFVYRRVRLRRQISATPGKGA